MPSSKQSPNQQIRRIRHNLTKTALRRPLIWLRHRRITTEDVFVASYPRSGSTWLRFLLFEALTGQPAEFGAVNQAIPRLGRQARAWRLLPQGGRLIQTHEPYRPEYHKAVYLVRDVRDVVLSEYSFQRGQGLYRKSLEDFVESFLLGRVNGYGPWTDHVRSWLDSAPAQAGRVLVVKFEDLRRDPAVTLSNILLFLGAQARISVQQAIENNTVEKMREKESRARTTVFKAWSQDHRFVRQGSVEGWRDSLTDDHIRQVEQSACEVLVQLGYAVSERAT